MSLERRGTSDRSSQRDASSPWSLDIGKAFGVPIRLHITFLLLLGWLAFVAFSSGSSQRLMGFLFVACLFGCVLLHELGHSVVAKRFGVPVRDIVLYPIGGVARMEKMPTPAQELWIALAGPAVNVVIAAGILLLLSLRESLAPFSNMRLGDGHWWHQLAAVNVMLVVFNMIPAFPMDGGRVLRALLAMRLGETRGTEIAAGIGQFLAFVIGFFALIVGNFLLVLIALFVFITAGQEAQMYRGKALLEGVTVVDAMLHDIRVLPAGATLKDAADLLLDSSQQDFPVMHAGEVIGLLTRQALLRGLASEGPSAYVTGAMDRNFIAVGPDADLNELLGTLQNNHAPVLVVQDGRLLGMVTMENVAELLVLRQILQRQAAGSA